MIFRQITHDDLGCASYLVGDDDAGLAAVVDPRLDIDEYLRLARYLGTRIEHVLETHNHADHVSGHGRLAASTGATIHIHRAATPEYDHVPFDDGWKLVLGRLVVRALHTPGHRPEHTAFALVDTDRGPGPWAVLTGDSLFVGGIARPTSPSTPARARTASSTRFTAACSRCPTPARCGPGTSAARRGARRRRRRRRGGGHLRVGPARCGRRQPAGPPRRARGRPRRRRRRGLVGAPGLATAGGRPMSLSERFARATLSP
jgi:glyoxylase-like metal-dependent hydrolase (beta-lactamase superfamily II)